MADTPKIGIRSLAAGLASSAGRAGSEALGTVAKAGAAAKALDSLTSSAQAHAEMLEKMNKLQKEQGKLQASRTKLDQKVLEQDQKHSKVIDKLTKAREHLEEAKKKGGKATEHLQKQVKELEKSEKDLRDETIALNKESRDLAESYKDVTEELGEMSKAQSMAGKAMGFLKAGAIGAIGAIATATLSSYSDGARLAASSTLRFHSTLEELSGVGVGDLVGRLTEMSSQLSGFQWEMAKLGYTGEEAAQMFNQVTAASRDNRGSMVANAQSAMRLTKQLAMMSSLMRMDSSEVIKHHTTLMDDFGMSQREATDAIANVYHASVNANKAFGDGILKVEDLASAVFEASSASNSYALNIRFLTRMTAAAAAAAQEQGATYKEALDFAKALANIATGKEIPDWLQNTMGKKFEGKYTEYLKKYNGDLAKTSAAMVKYFKIPAEDVDEFNSKLRLMQETWSQMDQHTRRKAFFRLGVKTETGTKEMLEYMHKTFGGGPEFVHMLKSTFNITDDQAMLMSKLIGSDKINEAYNMISTSQEQLGKDGKETKTGIEGVNEQLGEVSSALDSIAKDGVENYLKNLATKGLQSLLNISANSERMYNFMWSTWGESTAETLTKTEKEERAKFAKVLAYNTQQSIFKAALTEDPSDDMTRDEAVNRYLSKAREAGIDPNEARKNVSIIEKSYTQMAGKSPDKIEKMWLNLRHEQLRRMGDRKPLNQLEIDTELGRNTPYGPPASNKASTSSNLPQQNSPMSQGVGGVRETMEIRGARDGGVGVHEHRIVTLENTEDSGNTRQ